MKNIIITEIQNDATIATVISVAIPIWREYYVPMIGAPQVEYMLEKFHTAGAIQNQIAEGYRYFLVNDPNETPIGYFAVLPEKDELFLSKFYVAAPHRGHGYGTQAMRYIETLAKNSGLSTIYLNVNKTNAPSIAIYKKLGFTITEPIRIDIGGGFFLDDYRMKKIRTESETK